MPAPTLAKGCVVTVRERFDYPHPATGVTWAVEYGQRLILLSRTGDSWRVRCGELVMSMTAAELARVTSTEGG